MSHAASRRGALAALLVLSAAGGHLVYPAALGLAARGRRRPPCDEPAVWPGVTVVVPAYHEGGGIAARIADLHANGYPGPLEVVVVADDEVTARRAEGAGARVVHNPARVGKAAALGIGVGLAAHPVVVLTDANNRLSPGALALLVRRLGEPGVGAVAGMKLERDGGGEELYSRFERWLKERESSLGSTIGTSGELVALHRALWRDIPADVAVDDLWLALDLIERGHRVVYEPDARSIEGGAPTAEQWERRTRITAGILVVLWRKRALLRRPGLVSAEIVGHKLWRSSVGPLSHVALLALASAEARRSVLARVFLGGHVVAGAALLVRARRPLPVPLAAAAEVLFLQAVALGGMVRLARRGHSALWPKVAR